MKKTIVHFGGGALGRGLVIPLLVESGYDVILADADDKLINELKNKNGYTIIVTDEHQEKQNQFIPIKEAVSINTEKKEIRKYLNDTFAVTTAVRKENLIHVAEMLAHSIEDPAGKIVICAENIENVSFYFKELLNSIDVDQKQKEALGKLIVPDTIVDRICSSNWPTNCVIHTEKFYELAVDKNTLSNTKIELISAIDNIEGAFARKRLMVNTYADASAFLALSKGRKFLHEAIMDESIQKKLTPYFETFKIVLIEKYGYSAAELDKWHDSYQRRLSNPEIKRELASVARNLWTKMTLEERFMWPVIELLNLGKSVEKSVEVLVDLIRQSSGETNSQIKGRIKKMWNTTPQGREILQIALNYL